MVYVVIHHFICYEAEIKQSEPQKNFSKLLYYSVHSPLSAGGEGAGEPLTKFSKRGGALKAPQLSEGVAGNEGGEFWGGRGGCNFHKKNILKSEIFKIL